MIVCYHVESWRPLSWNRTNIEFSSTKQKKSSQNTNVASTMKRNFLRCEFMRNLTYGVIEVQAVSLLPRIEVHLRISLLASRLNVKDHNIVVTVVDNKFSIFAPKCLFEYYYILKKKLHLDERNWMHWLCLFVARIIRKRLVKHG